MIIYLVDFDQDSINEHEARVYNCGDVDENSFTKADLLSIHLSEIISKYQISRAAYRELVRFVNTTLRDYNEMKSGKYIKYTV